MRSARSKIRISHYLLAILLLQVTNAPARQPEVRNVNLRALQIGKPTTLTVDGSDLLPAPKVYLDDQPIEVVVDPSSTSTRAVLSITLPETIPPGIGVLRLATAEGFSNSLLMGLDRLPQLSIADEATALPVALHGSVPGSGVSKTAFQGKAGEEVIIEVEARRLGSKLRPVLHVFDSKRLQVGAALPSNTLAGDCRIVLKLPRDDRYFVELHDLQYAPPGASYFRLKVGQWQFADLAFPPAIAAGQEAAVELLGRPMGGRTTLKIAPELDLAPVVWAATATASGPPPSVVVSSIPELIEPANTDASMPLPGIPVAVSGRLNVANQKDRFRLSVTPGARIICDVFAERIGSRVDAVLDVLNKDGGVLASMDDGPNTTDPRLEYTVPAGIDTLDFVVRDNVDAGGEDAVYRLVLTSADAPKPTFDIAMKLDAVNIAPGEPQVMEAHVLRRGYTGPIQLQVGGLPPGIQVQGNEIPAGANGTLMTFLNSTEAPAALVTRIKAQSPDGAIVRTLSTEAAPDDRTPTWLRDRIALAAAAKQNSPFQVAWLDDASMPQLVQASKKPVAVKLTRPVSTFGPVRLSLMTAQPQPKANGQPNLPLAVRIEQVVEVPVDPAVKAAGDALAPLAKQHADAIQQAATAQGDAKVAADAKVADLATKVAAAQTTLRDAEAKANYQPAVSLVVPSVLSESVCDITVRAELLNVDRNVVLRTVYTPVRRLNVLNPLLIKLASPAVEATLDPAAGATIKLAAKIERLAGYAGDITVTVAGLPTGVSAANVVVKADQTDAAIELKIPANFAAEEIKGIKLTATGPPDPLTANQPLKSADVDLMVKVLKLVK